MHTALVDLLRGRLPMTPARTAFCWAHVEDTARGHIQAMEKGKPGETYIITGARHTFADAFDMAARLAKVRQPLLHPGPHTMRALSFLMKGVGPHRQPAAAIAARKPARPGRHDLLRIERKGRAASSVSRRVPSKKGGRKRWSMNCAF